MVAIVSGNSLGLSLGSLATLGQRGVMGSAGQGRNGEAAYVNVANGNLVLQDFDDRLVGRGVDIATVRTYNSQGLFDDDNGDNWRVGAHGQKLQLAGTVGTAGSTLTRTDRDGASAVYAWNATKGLYVSSAGAEGFDTIAYDAGNARYVWTDGDTGLVERYDAAQGRLQFVSDPSGNTVSYTYNANGTLQSAVDANGETTTFVYSGTNLTEIRTVATGGAMLTRVRYAYDGANRLSSVTVDLSPEDNSVADAKVYVTTYTYDGTSKRIASVTQSDGTSLAFTYVQSGGAYKVATVTDALGQITRFSYDLASSTSTVTDPLGARSTYQYDAQGQLLQVRQGVTAGNLTGLSQVSYRYDSAGNVTGITDGEGHEVAYEYDANGNLLKEVDSAGNTRTRTYNAANQLLTDTIYADASVSRGGFSRDAALPEITRYVYAQGNLRQLRFVVTAQGNVTEHRYDSYGQRIVAVRYAGGTYDIAALGATSVPTDAQMLAWLGNQDLRRTERTDYAYDARGSLASATTYGDVDAAGAGTAATAAKTQYVYDQHGYLLKKIEPTGGGTSTYIYDGLGRMLSKIEPTLDGATPNTTITSYDDAGGKTSVTLANGLVSVSAYDKAGRLVSVTQQSQGTGVLGATKFFYDKDGNLLMTQDPTGSRKWMLYDEASRKIAEVDATGGLIEYVYNANGQLRQTIAYSGRVDIQKLVDSGGAPRTSWSPDGSTTGLAAIRPAGTPQDQKVWRFYDSASRLAWQVDALGYVTQTTYDGASRILSVTQLAKPIDVTPLLQGASVDLGVDPASLGGIALSLDNANPVPAGRVTVLTATAEGTTSGGMVTFFDGETIIGSAMLVDGKASLVIDRLSVGTHSLRVAFSGDALRPASVSTATKKTILPVTTAGNLTYINPVAGSADPLVLSMAIAAEPAWLTPASGKVVFYNGDVVLGEASVINGVASLSVSNWPTTSAIVSRLPAGLAAAIAVTGLKDDLVLKALSSALEAYASNEQIAYADISFNQVASYFKVNLSTPGSEYRTGSIFQALDAAFMGRGTQWPQIRLALRALASDLASLGRFGGITGKLNVRAEYLGDALHAGAVASQSFVPAPPSMTLTASATQVTGGGPVTLQANVKDVRPGGRVDFFVGRTFQGAYLNNFLGTASVVNGIATLVVDFLPAGDYAWNANYANINDTFSGVLAQGPVLHLEADQARSTTWPGIDKDGVYASDDDWGYWVDVYGLNGGRAQAGVISRVRVFDREKYLGTKGSYSVFIDGVLVGGLIYQGDASGSPREFNFALPAYLAPGETHRLSLFFNGHFVSKDFTVESAPKQSTTTSLSVASAKVAEGIPTTLKAKVTSVVTEYRADWKLAAQPISGTVTFYANGVAIGTAPAVNGEATLVVANLPQGVSNITVSYAGDTNYVESTLPGSVPIQITGAPVILTNLTTPSLAKDGSLSVRFSGKTPSGLVSFYSGTSLLGTVAVREDGTATLQGVPIPAGTHSFSAVYSGDEANADGAITFTQVVEGTPDAPRVLVGLDITQDRTVTQLLNRNGQVQGTLDAEGYLTEYKYNAAGEQVQSIRYANRAANFASVSARLMAVAIARASGDLSGVRPAASDGDIRTYNFYNARGQLVGQVDGEGFLTETVYDTRGNVTQTRRYASLGKSPGSVGATLASVRPDPSVLDQSVTQTWSAANQLLSRTNAEGTVTSFTYDVAGRLVQTTTAAGTPDERIQRLRYDIQGRLIAELDGRGSAAVAQSDPLAAWASNGATHTYDAAGRRTSSTDANGHRTLFFYDAFSRLTYTVNPMGEVTEQRYDALGQQSEQIVYGSRIDVSTLGASAPGGLDTSVLAAKLAAAADPAKDSRVVRKYNATGTLVSSTDAMGAITSYSYNAFREATSSSQTRLSGQVVTNTVAFDRRGLQVSATLDATGAAITRRTGYDAFGRPHTRIDGNGSTSSLRYDRLGRVVTTTDPSGGVRTTTYDAFDRVLTQRDALNNVTSYAYSVANRSVTVTTPEGVAVTTVHNRQGQTLSILDGRGNTTTYSYDKSGNLLKTQAPEGVATSFTYDKIGLTLTSTDAKGTVTAYVYDAADRVLTRTVDPGGLKLVTSYLYDAKGQTINVTDPGGIVTTTAYDLSGQVVRQTVDPSAGAYVGLNLQTVYTYDADGTTLSVKGADGRLTRYTYDGLGRRVKEQVDPLGLNLTRSYAYDAEGNVIKAVDASGNATLFIYDKANRLTLTIDAMGGVQQRGYDAEGRLSSQTTYAALVPVTGWKGVAPSLSALQAALPTLGLAATQSRRYDRDGRLRFTVDATGAVVEYRYDATGNVVESRAYAQRINLGLWNGSIDPPVVPDDVHDQRARNVYDALGRKTYSIDGTGAVVRQVFDASGNVTERFAYSKRVPLATAATTDALSSAVALVADTARDQHDTYAFDRGGRLTSHNDGAGGVTAQTFDSNGNVTSRTDANSQVTRYAYDSVGRLVYSLGPLGQLEKNDYDAAGRITLTTRYAKPISTTGLGVAPTVAQLRALAQQTTGQDQQQFNVYDQSGRLSATVDAMGSVVTFARDGNGNVTERTAWANPVDLATWVPGTVPVPQVDTARDQHTRSFYDGMGREALTIDALGFAVQRQYDANGRLTYVVRYPVAVPAATANMLKAQLDAATLLASTSGQPLQISAFGYDAAGNRTSQTLALGQPEAATTQYAYDGIGRLTRTIDARGVELSQGDSAWALNQRLQLKYLNAGGTALKASELSPAQRLALAALYTTVNDYDAAGRKLSVTDALGGATRSDYDANGHVVRITDPRGSSAFYYFDSAGRMTLSVDPEGYATASTYDALGHTLSVKRYFTRVSGTYGIAQPPALPAANPSDALTRFTYDGAGRLTKTIDAESNTESYTYNALGQRETLTNKLGGITVYTYDRVGRMASETLPITSKNAAGQLVGVVNQYAYDAFGNRISTTEAAGLPEQRIMQFKYDGLNREVEQRQAQVSIYMDGKGWSSIAPARTKTYDASGNLIAVTDPNGGRIRTWFDASNRKVAEVSATGSLSVWTYDAAGNVMEQSVYGDALAVPVGNAQPKPVNAANVRLTTYQVDANNRVTRSTIAGVQSGGYDATTHQYNMAITGDVVKRSFYDANGNVVREQNPNDAATLVWYDKLGQKVLEVDAMGYGVRWERDANGAVLRQTRYLQGIALGSLSESTALVDVLAKFRPATGDQITEYSYDRNSRVLSESRLNVVYGSVAVNGALSESSAAAIQRTAYDAMGNKTSTTDAQGQRSDMRYDAVGRLLGAQRPGAADFNGTLVRQATDYEYDGLGNVRREIRRGTDNAVESDDQIVRYGYDATGVRTSMTTAKGETISYGRDANGNTTAQMTDRLDADGAVSRDIVSIGYDAANREVRRFTGQRDASNMPVFNVANTITLDYNTFGELISKRTGSGNALGQAQEYYDYDKAGRLWRTNAQGGVNKAWMYDLAGNATLQLESQRVDLRAMTWAQIAGDGTQPSPDILITITAFDQNNRVVSVMQPKMDASRPNLRMISAPINVDSGKFGGLDIDVAPALAEANSTGIAGPSDGSATGQVGAIGMSISGGNIRPIRNGEFGGAGGSNNISSTVVGVTDIVLGSSGNLENLYGALTWRVEVGGVPNYLGRPGSWPVTVHPRNSDLNFMMGQLPGTLVLGKAFAYTQSLPIRVIATTASGLDIVVSNGAVRQPPLATVDQTLSGTFMRLTGAEARDTDKIQLYSRARGSNGPYSESLPYFKAGQGGSSLNNVAVDGAYLTRLDGQGPLDILLIVTQSDGTVVRRQSIQYDPASGQSSSSVAPAQPVFTSDNVAHFTGLRINGSAIRVLQRPQGSQGVYSERTYWPSGATGRFDVQFDAGASDVIIEVLDMTRNVVVDRLKGTVNPGASYYDMRPLAALPSSITFRDIPIDARTLQIDYEPLSPGGLRGSITIPRSAAGDIAQWVWDAANLIPDQRNLYSYKLHFVARDEDGFILSDATGEATIGAIAKEGTKARLTGNVKHQVMTFDPGIADGRTMKLRYREKGATAQAFTEVTATRVKANTAFKWDATANNLDPDKEYEFLYDVYSAAGAVIGNGEGYFRLNKSADNRDVRWAIPNLPGEDIINNSWVIQRRQTYDAFGQIVSEIDGNNNINELSYNTLGLLVEKRGPSVEVMQANGQLQTTRPTEHYSYDLNRQLVGKRDANGNESTVQLDAAGQAVAEWHPGAAAGSASVLRKRYDVFGNLRTVTDEIGRVTSNTYDANNRLARIDRPVNADGSRAYDTYDYDVLGQRIAHANALNFRERTYYDTMGRVTRYVSPEGAIVNYGYTYDASIGSAGGVNTGGWINTTTDANGRTQTLKSDLSGRVMWKQDLGGHQFTYGYNWSGLIATQTGSSGQNISYSYYDNGYLRKVIDLGVSTESTFEYDNNGNRIFEGFKSTAGDAAMVFQWSRVSYDAFNRVKTVDDARYVINYDYDANGNRRHVKSTYLNIVDQSKDVQDYWYTYDGMNRFTTTMGQLVNGQIVRGSSGDGVSIEYDDAGQRKAATYASDGHREDYAYDGAGNLTEMAMGGVLRSRRTNDLAGRVTRYEEWFKDGTLSTQKDRTWNKDNQLTVELEHRLTEGTGGRKWSDTTTAYTLMKDGTLSKVDSLTNAFNNFNPSAQDPAAVITRMISTYAYDWWDSAKQTSITLDPTSTGYDPRRPQPPGYSAFGYDVNGHLKTASDLNATTLRSFSYWTNAEGQVLQRQELIGGKIGTDGNVSGASKSRDHRYFYFDGKRVGNVGNDGVEREDYAQQFARSADAGNPDAKYRKFTPTNSADFDENYQPINAGFPGPAPGSYTVRAGDTLEGIARALWGDATLWYLLAEANGLDGQPSAALVGNTVLAVPNRVTNVHNTSETFRPYDPGKAMGDTSPTLPDPLPAPKGKSGGCGGVGQLIMAVVAVVATIYTAGAAGTYFAAAGSAGAAGGFAGGVAVLGGSGGFAAAVGAGVVGGAVGSIASQAVGMAIGAQDSFSWKGVALGALGGGVSAGAASWLSGGGAGAWLAGKGGDLAAAGRMAIGNVASQGLSIATGLQKGFDWRGVAASAASGYVSAAAGAWAKEADWSLAGQRLAGGLAGGLMSAAVRGGSVGRALPGIIGDAVGAAATVGNALGDSIAAANSSGSYRGVDPTNPYGYKGSGGGITNWQNNAPEPVASDNRMVDNLDIARGREDGLIVSDAGGGYGDLNDGPMNVAAAGGVKFMNRPRPAIDSSDVAESKRLAAGTRARREEKLDATYREGAELWAKGDALNEQPFNFDNRAESAERIASIKDMSRQERAWNRQAIIALEDLKQAGGITDNQEHERLLRIAFDGQTMAFGAMAAAPLGGMTAPRPRMQERLPSEVARGGAPEVIAETTTRASDPVVTGKYLENFKSSSTPLELVQERAGMPPAQAQIRLDHILDGDVRVLSDGTAVGSGGHYLRSPNMRVTEWINGPDSKGVSEGYISVRNLADGSWAPKSGRTTFYPEDWTRRQTQLEIQGAFQNSSPVSNSLWEGTSPSGLIIRGYYGKPAGTGATAWPVRGR